jgi:hypothetical protein
VRLLALALVASGRTLGAQGTIAARVAAAPADAAVAMSYPARAGVCGDGRSYVSLGRSTISNGAFFDGREPSRGPCEPGPVRVVLERRGHAVEDVRTTVGSAATSSDATVVDIGAVDPVEAADYLMTLARGEKGRVAERALLPAVLADRAVVWPALLAIARDSTRAGRRSPRSSAAFWLSRFAAAAGEGRPGDLSDRDSSPADEDDDADVRGRAVFALAQLPRQEGIPGLVDVARHHRDPRVRAKALFWLGQSGDARAYALFEELLKNTR